MRNVNFCLFVSLFVLAPTAFPAQIAFEWTPTSFQTVPTAPGAERFVNVPGSINDSGVVTVTAAPNSGPVTWDGSAFQSYPVPAGYLQGYGGINNAGAIGGTLSSGPAGLFETGAIWNPDRSVTIVGSPVAGLPSRILGVNNANLALGIYFDADAQGHLFRYNSGASTLLNGFFSRDNIDGGGINDAGAVISNARDGAGSFRALYWAPGSQSPISLPCSSNLAIAFALNNQGDVAGRCGSSTVLWDQAGNMRIIAELGSVSSIRGLNDSGQLAGTIFADIPGTTGQSSRPFVWSAAGGLQFITGPDGLPIAGEATGINSSGTVIGYGQTVTSPIPEPASAVLTGGATILLIARLLFLRKRSLTSAAQRVLACPRGTRCSSGVPPSFGPRSTETSEGRREKRA